MKKFYLDQALHLAEINRGFCAPNPSVGALIVSEQGEVLAKGFHNGPGTAHAEIEAIKQLETIPENSILYVTLEPCCHFGRTPPCTDAIIKSGIKKVIYGYKDPNPIVSGKGEATLKKENISCEHFETKEINDFYKSYHYWHVTKLPFITAKIAITADGKIADENSKPIKITGEEINVFTHAQRKKQDAILTTVRTIINDDPQLNARINDQIYKKPLYILDKNLELPLNSKIFSTAKNITVFCAVMPTSMSCQPLLKACRGKLSWHPETHVRYIQIECQNNLLNLKKIIEIIGQDGIHDLWIEAGGKCFTNFLENNLVQKAFIYISPKILGKGLNGPDINKYDFSNQQVNKEKIGEDSLLCILW